MLIVGAVIGQRQELEPCFIRLSDLVGDRDVALGAVLAALPRQAAVAGMIVMNVQVALEPGARREGSGPGALTHPASMINPRIRRFMRFPCRIPKP